MTILQSLIDTGRIITIMMSGIMVVVCLTIGLLKTYKKHNRFPRYLIYFERSLHCALALITIWIITTAGYERPWEFFGLTALILSLYLILIIISSISYMRIKA